MGWKMLTEPSYFRLAIQITASDNQIVAVDDPLLHVPLICRDRAPEVKRDESAVSKLAAGCEG